MIVGIEESVQVSVDRCLRSVKAGNFLEIGFEQNRERIHNFVHLNIHAGSPLSSQC